MALSKSSSAITQLTASGTSTTATISAGVSPLVSLYHSNGTGSVSAAATAQVQYRVDGAARWYSPTSLLVTFGTTAAAVESRRVSLPDSATSSRIVYTAPTGPTGYTLDAETSYVTP